MTTSLESNGSWYIRATFHQRIFYLINLPPRIFHNSAHFRNGALLFVRRSHEIAPGTWETLYNGIINHSVELLDCCSNCARSCQLRHGCVYMYNQIYLDKNNTLKIVGCTLCFFLFRLVERYEQLYKTTVDKCRKKDKGEKYSAEKADCSARE